VSDGTFLPSGVTPWSAYNTPRIWAMVENEDDPESWRQVAALGSMAGLLKDQRSRLEDAKQKLIDAWPPETNKASAAFVELIDNLLLTMQENKQVADSNAAALGQVLEALRQAKAHVAPLYQSYLEKSDDWVPGWWDNAEDELDEQARERMREAEKIIAHPDNTLRSPDPYEFAPGEYVSKRIGTGDSGGNDAVTPPSVGAAGGFQVPHDPPPALPSTGVAGPSPSVPSEPLEPGIAPGGPDLAGVITPAPAPAPSVAPIAPSVPIGPSIGQPPAGLVIGGGFPTGLPGPGARGGRGGFAPPGGRPTGGGPGGLGAGHGGVPAAKPATPSWLPTPPSQPPRSGTGAGGRGGGSSVMPATGGRRSNEDRAEGMTFDSDNPWATAEGVPPVIEPSRKRHRHDPGPGVIGWRG